MAANPFSGQLQGLGIQAQDTQGGVAQDQPGDAPPGGRVARRMRRAAKKASQAGEGNLLAPVQAPKLSPQHKQQGRSHSHPLE